MQTVTLGLPSPNYGPVMNETHENLPFKYRLMRIAIRLDREISLLTSMTVPGEYNARLEYTIMRLYDFRHRLNRKWREAL